MPFSFRFSIALVLSIVCLTVPAWLDFQTGMDAYNRKDHETALDEWGLLAVQGNAHAQRILAVLYEYGWGMPQDYGQAQHWYEWAASQGNAQAQYSLGRLYSKGYGVPKDYVQARQWYEKAAAQGYIIAQYKLGVLYGEGLGVLQDFVQAHKWYSLAGANGDNDAATLCDALAEQMTPAQIDEAQKLARECKPKTP